MRDKKLISTAQMPSSFRASKLCNQSLLIHKKLATQAYIRTQNNFFQVRYLHRSACFNLLKLQVNMNVFWLWFSNKQFNYQLFSPMQNLYTALQASGWQGVMVGAPVTGLSSSLSTQNFHIRILTFKPLKFYYTTLFRL